MPCATSSVSSQAGFPSRKTHSLPVSPTCCRTHPRRRSKRHRRLPVPQPGRGLRHRRGGGPVCHLPHPRPRPRHHRRRVHCCRQGSAPTVEPGPPPAVVAGCLVTPVCRLPCLPWKALRRRHHRRSRCPPRQSSARRPPTLTRRSASSPASTRRRLDLPRLCACHRSQGGRGLATAR